jgi:hypothetical protein
MDAITVTAAASAVTGAAVTVATAWLRARCQRQQAREESRRDHLHHLPPGSRVVDLGEHGMMIEVGGAAARAKNARDAAR